MWNCTTTVTATTSAVGSTMTPAKIHTELRSMWWGAVMRRRRRSVRRTASVCATPSKARISARDKSMWVGRPPAVAVVAVSPTAVSSTSTIDMSR